MNPDPTTVAVVAQAVGTVGLLNALGYYLKRYTQIPNRFIPYILPVAGIVLECMISGWSQLTALNGFFSGLSAVGTHQAFRQVKSTPK